MRDAANPPSIRGAEPTGLAGGLRGIFRIPSPAERVRAWHVSPAIDMAAYHFSWLWVLLPLVFAVVRAAHVGWARWTDRY